MSDNLTAQLRELVAREKIRPDPNFSFYANGIYAVLDCVFSARAKWESVVWPLIKRFSTRVNEKHIWTFKAFVTDVDSFGLGKFERYADEVLDNRMVLSKQRKAEVAYKVARFLSDHHIERTADFHRLTLEQAEQLILTDLVNEIHGVGPALANYLMWLLGREDYVKVDTMLNRLFSSLSDWKPRLGNREDTDHIRKAITEVATELETTPARLDNALWKYESSGRKPPVWTSNTLRWEIKD